MPKDLLKPDGELLLTEKEIFELSQEQTDPKRSLDDTVNSFLKQIKDIKPTDLVD